MKDKSILLLFLICTACNPGVIKKETIPHYSAIEIQPIYVDETISIRALEIDKSGMLAYSGNNGRFGFLDPVTGIEQHRELSDSIANQMEFRGISFHSIGASFISAGSPALVYRVTYTDWQPKQEYLDDDPLVFYDSMEFWNLEEGIAFGDALDGCMSVLITRDGGESWKKLSCDEFPKAYDGEGAFAASDTNVEVIGDQTWLASKHKIYYSPDKGHTWQVFDTPIIQETETQGIYSLDFYDNKIGIAMGGDYTDADANTENLIKTEDGGRNWRVISSENSPGYRSCIQFVPNSGGQSILAVGFKGIDLSQDGGETWIKLSDKGFFTVRFLNEKEGFLAGRGSIAKFTLTN